MLLLVLLAAVPALVAFLIAWWASWLAQQYGAPRYMRHLRTGYAGMSALFGALAIVRCAVLWFKMTFEAYLSAADRARALAEAIADIFNWSVLAVVVLAPIVPFLAFMTLRIHHAPRPRPKGDPPYR